TPTLVAEGLIPTTSVNDGLFVAKIIERTCEERSSATRLKQQTRMDRYELAEDREQSVSTNENGSQPRVAFIGRVFEINT
ncbi:hypothetical protein K0M31_017476, partial [Melipona bicolor]